MEHPDEAGLTFNVVWTKSVYPYLRPFVASQLAHTTARYRYVVNGCPPDQVAAMEADRSRHPDRIVEVLDVSPGAMVPHGVALDRVRAQRDDGDHFCLIDPDIKANGPFVADLLEARGDAGAVTSGTEVWSDDNVVPDWQVAVAGEHFFDRDGFVWGSPHLAIYDRAALDATCDRWGVGLGSNGQDLRPDALARLAEIGRSYVAYDTAKVVNGLLQADGHALVHRDLTQLVHIGGLSHYLGPPGYITDAEGRRVPNWVRHEHMAARAEVTRYTAMTLRALIDGEAPPDIPVGLDPAMVERLELVRREVVDLVERWGQE